MDVHDKQTRSYNMSRIRSKDTKPELIVRSFLHKKGFRFRLHDKKLPGKPDIVLPKYRTVIFVHGCFWHGHKNCRGFTMPKSRWQYWEPKIFNNTSKDVIHRRELLRLSWNVIIAWECELKPKKAERTLQSIVDSLLGLNQNQN